MRKLFLVSAIALTMTGCAAQQESASPQVRDLSASRESSPDTHYTVEAGDTLYGIAWRHDMDYRDLARLNQIGPPYRIQPGQRLRLQPEGEAPSGSESAAQVEDGAVATATALGGGEAETDNPDWLLPDEEAIARNRSSSDQPEDDAPAESGSVDDRAAEDSADPVSDTEAEREPEASSADDEESAAQEAEPAEAEASSEEDERRTEEGEASQADAGTEVAGAPERSSEAASRTYTPVEEVPWQWPVEGDVIGRYGEGDSITAGIDIAGQKGQSVKAAGPGIVVYAGSGVRGYGNLVLIKHNDQYLSAYAHNDSLQVSENDVVDAGDVIATMGDSDAESVRLHFEVRKDGQPQDPLEYLPSR
ncbi:peptidoglycan DD-metalloendopeptidase family protein [Billgrantia gudaonensis]|uniref:Lipoprotein NlpD n=1 Tax=Billgrantia gudaonensis TaxID=376427 RepID=A0A1G8UFT0_9GAMM|nr:peptidoglycan DD-metalloendopeptidase family protein [Halomonas gudaonensis]SDJ52736.1 lipoprotein NlpD [Halomonas gudaonensis]